MYFFPSIHILFRRCDFGKVDIMADFTIYMLLILQRECQANSKTPVVLGARLYQPSFYQFANFLARVEQKMDCDKFI